MRRIFVDAGYWIAVLNPSDPLHPRALVIIEGLGRVKMVTSQVVLAEFLDHFASFGSHFREAAADVVKNIQLDDDVTVVAQTSALFADALDLYHHRPDKKWGFSDCTSFVIMQEEDIAEALAYDAHFQQAGFVALLRNEEKT